MKKEYSNTLKKYFGCVRRSLFQVALAGGFLLSAATLWAADITIPGYSTPGETPPIWISMSGFSGEANDVLQFDLYVHGFNFTNAEAAQYILNGSNNGNLQGRVTDRYSKETKLSKAYTGGSLRRQAHTFA